VAKILIAIAFGCGALTGALAWLLVPSAAVTSARTAAELMDAVMWGTEPVGGPFALIDHNGKPRTDADFRGKLLLVYFGFSYCTDVCPTDLQSVAAAVDKLGPDGEKVQPLFISIDPEKDTPEQLQGYVALFHPRLIGLTGTPRQTRKAALAYKVYVASNGAATGTAGAIDHSGFVYLVGARGEYLGFFPPGTSADRMVQAMRPRLVQLAEQ
jgi:cytochrome oxidase Cu insertion factor (SCO1/SenC/PrrC family)